VWEEMKELRKLMAQPEGWQRVASRHVE